MQKAGNCRPSHILGTAGTFIRPTRVYRPCQLSLCCECRFSGTGLRNCHSETNPLIRSAELHAMALCATFKCHGMFRYASHFRRTARYKLSGEEHYISFCANLRKKHGLQLMATCQNLLHAAQFCKHFFTRDIKISPAIKHHFTWADRSN